MAPPPITTSLTNVLTVILLGQVCENFKVFLLSKLSAGPGTEADHLSLDRMIIPHLYSQLHKDYQYLVENPVSATAAFKSLKSHFEKSNMTNCIVGRAELNAVCHDPSKDISVYTCAMADAVKKLTVMGVTIDNAYYKDLLLSTSIPPIALSALSFSPALRRPRSKTSPTSSRCLLLILGSSRRMMASVPLARRLLFPVALALAATSSSSLTGSISLDGFPQESQGFQWCDPTNSNCHRCGRVGHIGHKCMHTMPAFVKDWINSNLCSFSHTKLPLLDAGLDPEVFLELWGIHVTVMSLTWPLIGLSRISGRWSVGSVGVFVLCSLSSVPGGSV
ncbi:hypothetical protein R3P38DRAFT_3289481 [Favolaschia claudopus]|uniref:CCHC-type domain-containing protein n=1 Tax=Favolaschia claudopus TaxID=2862362 RepID=A0AAV9ZUQ0_9AGAR